jgi:hypothetical protein
MFSVLSNEEIHNSSETVLGLFPSLLRINLRRSDSTKLHEPLESEEEDRGSSVVKVLRYKSEDHWFDSRWCHWNFSLT